MRFRERSFTLFFITWIGNFLLQIGKNIRLVIGNMKPISVAKTGGTKEAFRYRINHIRKCAIVLVHTGLLSFSKTTALMKFNPRLRGPPSSDAENSPLAVHAVLA